MPWYSPRGWAKTRPHPCQACAGLECLGLELDAGANAVCSPDVDIARTTSPGRILVIATREDLTMLHEVLQVLGKN